VPRQGVSRHLRFHQAIDEPSLEREVEPEPANVFGEQLKDVGRVEINPRTGEILFSAGPHPIREGIEAGDELEPFCAVFD